MNGIGRAGTRDDLDLNAVVDELFSFARARVL